MSKTMKSAIMRDYKSRVAGSDSGKFPDAMLISIRALKARDTTAVRNSLAKKTFEGSGLSLLNDLLTGPSALAYGGDSVIEVAREVVALMEKFPKLELKGAVLDGTLFTGKKGCEELSKFPTKDEAIAQVVTLIVSPARKLMGQIKGPVSKVGGLIKAIEAKLEKGEAITKIG